MKRIMVGIDGSHSSIQAARFAGELAEATGAELVVVHVLAPGETPDGPLPPRMAAVLASYERGRERPARERAVGALEGLRLSWSFLERLGDPAEQLEAVADQERACQLMAPRGPGPGWPGRRGGSGGGRPAARPGAAHR